MTPGPRAHSKEVKFTVKFMKRDKCFKKSVRVLELFLIFFSVCPMRRIFLKVLPIIIQSWAGDF